MMVDRRRGSPESSTRRTRDLNLTYDDEPERMRFGAESPSSSTSSSYIDISHTYKSGLRSFFTAPSERRRLRKRRSNHSLRSHSSASSTNLDLAYGTGYLKRPKRRGVRSRKGKEIDREKGRDSGREGGRDGRKARDSNRPPTDAAILAVGAGLAKLARDQNKLDRRSPRNGKRAEVVAVRETTGHRGYGPGRDQGSSKISRGSGAIDEDGWESASDGESESSVDSRLAFGGDAGGGWFGWGRSKPQLQRRKTSIVDPKQFGPANSLHGILTEPVGFGEISWDPSSDFGQRSPYPVAAKGSPPSGSQTSLQRVYPVATSDPSRFETARSSVVSGSEPFVSSRAGGLPLQQPQPIAPVSQSVYEPKYSAPSDPGVVKKASSSHGRSKSLAEAALAGVGVATAGAVIASERRDDRSDRRRDSDRDDRVKRRDSERKEVRDDRRRDSRQSPDREERRERRREKERQRESSDGQNSERRRERRYDDPRYDDPEERREKRREDRRGERPESRYDDPYYKGTTSSSKVPVDPFQYQVDDDAFETPKSGSPPRKADHVPTVVTVEREPDFSRMRDSSTRNRAEPDDNKRSYRGREHREKDVQDPEPTSKGSGHSSAAIAAIGTVAAAAAASAAYSHKSAEPRSDRWDDYDSRDYNRQEREPAKEPQAKSKPERDPVQEEADRAYREIVMARKIASQVIRSRTPSPNRSVARGHGEDEEEEEIIRVVTPPATEEEDEKDKEKGPYDAPNADFKLDLVLEDPRHLRDANIPRIDFDGGSSSLKLDPDASAPRPFLNLVRPTPTPSPAPEKQVTRSEPTGASTSTEQGEPKSTTSEVAVDSKDNVSSPTSSTVSKGVTWGENETKHYEVESPHEHKDEFVSSAEVQTQAKEVEQPKPSRPMKRSGWGAVVAGITGAGVGAIVASPKEASQLSKSKEIQNERDDKPLSAVDPKSAHTEPSSVSSSQIPGAFDDDLDFAATVAAGLQDTGFDPNIVINDPSFRRRESPPGSNELRRKGNGDVEQHDEPYTSRDLVEEPESSFEPQKLSKKEQRKRDKATQRQDSQSEDLRQVDPPIVADELVEEPESYGSSKKSKSKKSKRESSTYDDAEDIPRQSRRISIPVDAFEDLRNGEDEWQEPKKSKKKSKRDSENYDSPSRSGPSEAASEFDTPSGKKSKSKSRRKSGQYDPDPDPTEVSLPPSASSEVGQDGDGPVESRSVVSADGSRYDEEPRRSKKKSRSGTKDEFDDARSVASAPVGDDSESSKSKKKDKRSSGGFFGLFGSKSEVDAIEQSPQRSKDDTEETMKKSKKSKRNSEPTSYDVGPESFDDLPRASSNGHGPTNGLHHSDDDDGVLRRDGESNKNPTISESTSADNESFLDKAGILGAGAGIAGLAIAIAAQHHQQSKADLDNSNVAREPADSEPPTSLHQHDEIFDPEIVPRQFRPSIDPQYGDLLPLPPSGPASPNVEPIDDLPELPDSRPDTPEAERIARDRAISSARKILHDGPIKSPSQSAVPLKFIMGNRSLPSSPGLSRSSPLQSPVVQHQESLASPRNRSRPTSWDSTKEYKPLYLVETNRRGSMIQQKEPEEPLPELPPSQRTSRSSSELDFHDAVAEQSPKQSPLDVQERFTRPLSIDTDIPSAEIASELLGSQQSTPKAGMQPEDSESTRSDSQHPDYDAQYILPTLPPTSSLLLNSDDQAQLVDQQKTNVDSIAETAPSSSIGYFASSPSHRLTSQAWLDELAHSPSIRRQPSPVEPMTKDRSSYLLQSSPLSKKADDEEAFDPNLNSATTRQLFSYADGDSLQSIQEREADHFFESTSASSDIRDQHETSQDILATSTSHSQSTVEAIRGLADDDAAEQAAPKETELGTMPIGVDAEPVDEFVLTSSKKNKKKDKKKGKRLSLSATSDDLPVPEPIQETPLDDFASASVEPLEEPSYGKSKKGKKKGKGAKPALLDWEPQEEESMPQLPENSPLETPQDPLDEPSTAKEFAAVKTKGKKKADKKTFTSSLLFEPEEDSATLSLADPEMIQETSREVIDPIVVSQDSKPAEPKPRQVGEMTEILVREADQSQVLGQLPTPDDSILGEGKGEENTSSARELEGEAIFEPQSHVAPVVDNLVATPEIGQSKKGEEVPSHSLGVDKDIYLGPEPVSQEPETVDEFFMATSKKSKKKGKKYQTKKLDDVASFDTTTASLSKELADAADETPSAKSIDEDFQQVPSSGSKKSKKKSKKSQSWDQDYEPQSVTEDAPREEIDKLLATMDDGDLQKLPTSSEPAILLKDSYFPSATGLHSPQPPQSPEPASKGYFPSATAVLPVAAAGAAFVGASLLKHKDQDAGEVTKPQYLESKPVETTKDQLPQLETDPSPTVPDGLKAGYDNEQLSLAKRLQEEFGIGSKKSKKDKKKRQSLPVTPDREISRSRATEDDTDIQPRARSLSIGPSANTVAAEEMPEKDQPKTLYSEDQLELARQLKAEFGSGDKKSKKDKKKRPGLARSATFDENDLDHGAEPSPSLLTESPADPVIDDASTKADGFAAGYQEDQLSLARQLQAEFGSGSKKSKKDKKDKKRQSTSQTPPQVPETTSDYFGELAQASGVESLKNDDTFESPESSTVGKDTTRDGLAVGYSAEQLELARQLKEEFSSGSKGSKKDKKDKKDKKRKSLLRNSSDDPPDDGQESERGLGVDTETPNLATDETALNEPVAADPEDEFTFTTKKKGKKGKKRDSLLAKVDGNDVGSSSKEKDIAEQELGPESTEVTNAPVPEIPEDDFALATTKSKKGKKGKKQVTAFELDDKDVVEQGTEPLPTEMASTLVSAIPEDEFEPITKKSKKGKKEKKQGNNVELEDKDFTSPRASQDRGMEPDIAPLPAVEISEPAVRDPTDEFAFVSKKSKKGKKGKKRVDWDDEVEPSLESTSKEKDVEPDVELASVESAERALDDSVPVDLGLDTEKAKKGSEGENIEGPVEEAIQSQTFGDQVNDLHNAESQRSADFDAGLGEDLAATPPEEVFFTTKKSKKGKKKQADTPAEPVESTLNLLDSQPKQTEQSPYIEAAADVKDIEKVPAFGEPDESDKSRQIPKPPTSDETLKEPELPTPKQPEDIQEETVERELQSESQVTESQEIQRDEATTVDNSATTDDPLDNSFEDFSFTTKKSKKDKKNRKGQLAIALFEEPEATPAGLGITHTEPTESPLSTKDVTDDLCTDDVAPLHTLQDIPSLGPTPNVPAGELADDWAGFSTKKSKKDKKKRASGVPTVAETSAVLIEAKRPRAEQELDDLKDEPASVDDKIFPLTATQDEPPAEPVEDPNDEWGSFSMKKSKKDKKKRKSGISTPAEASTTLVEEQKPVDKDILDDPKSEPPFADDTISATAVLQNDPLADLVDEPNDEWANFSTKKSKKDKKKRKSGLSTPAEASATLDEAEKPDDNRELDEPKLEPASLDDDISAPKAPEVDLPRDMQAADEPTVDEFEFTTKKSKKDKKKAKKSGLSTPVGDSLTIDRAVHAVLEVQTDGPKVALSELQPEQPDFLAEQSLPQGHPDPTTDDADFGFATKKSKKNKAKRESLAAKSESSDINLAELTTPASLSESNIESQDSLTAEQSGENSYSTQKEPRLDEEPVLKAKTEPISTESQEQVTDQGGLDSKSEVFDPASSGVEWKTLKHDKRKRQATIDASISNESGPSKAPPISWADEVEEAEVERKLPVIHDIAKDESLSHIASSTRMDDFRRPAKKGKKGKKKNIEWTEPTSTADSSSLPAEISSAKDEPIQEQTEFPVLLAAAGAVLGGATLLSGKSEGKKVELSTEQPDKSKDVQQAETIQHSEQPREVFDTPDVPEDASFQELSSTDRGRLSTPPPDLVEPRSGERSLPLQKEPAEHEPVTPLNTFRYSHPGSSSLPVLQEESPEATITHPAHVQEIDDINRDSAFVTDSPVPQQRGFSDDSEHNRDSGVHLRDSSPYENPRAPGSSDAAIARMAWPAIDEESETVDLHGSQRPTVKQDTRSRDYAEDTHSAERSLPEDVSGTGFSRMQRSQEEILPVHHVHGLSPAQLHSGEPASKHPRFSSPKHEDDRLATHRDVHPDGRDDLPSQRDHPGKPSGLHRSHAIHMSKSRDSLVKQRVQRIESPDFSRSERSPGEKYGDLGATRRPKAEQAASPPSSSPTTSGLGITGAPLGFAASRIASQEQRARSTQSPSPSRNPDPSPRALSNINRLRSPDPRTPVRPESVGSNRSTGTPPLRRSDRKSGDLRSLSQRNKPDLAKEAELAALTSTSTTSLNTANPTANEGRVRAKEMADVYDGFGEGRMGSPRSPTRPHSMRRRQSMQVLDLESRLEQLAAENRQLAEAKTQAEQALQTTHHSSAALVERDAEIEGLKRTLNWLQNEVTRLTEVNDGLTSANITLGSQHNERYGQLESQHAQATRELEEVRETHNNLLVDRDSMDEIQNTLQDKDREIAQLRADLEAAKDRIREMQMEILASKANDSEFLVVRDEDYFDSACQNLCKHVQQWVLRFSKFSDMRACRLTSEINNDKTIDRLDNAILDGSDVDSYLSHRVKRRDVFMSMTMTMVWEFVFTRYLFGMDREQRQKLKSLEKSLAEVGPVSAVHQWRATTLTLLSKREAFVQQREQDTRAVVHAVLETLSEILPPPSHLEAEIQEQLVRVIKAAVELSIEMRTQRAEYMMLPPLQPEYDANGDLASKVTFNAALMNERSGDTESNEELEESGAVVKIVLFPLVVKKGDDGGGGDEEIVVCPAQVLVTKPKRSVRVFSPESMANQSRVSMQSTMPAEQWERVDM